MKALLVAAAVASGALFTVGPGSAPQAGAAAPPPIEQRLIPEGYFAGKLAEALHLGTPEDDAQAETLLADAGIAPRNGWIATYPVTPDIVGELRRAVADAADAGALDVGRDEAVAAFDGVVSTEIGASLSDQPPDATAQAQGTDAAEPSSVAESYETGGPPVVTYYPPPPGYAYLYAPVDSPFWCNGYFFPRFYVLSDFDLVRAGRVPRHGHRRDRDDDRGRGAEDRRRHRHEFEVTNHVVDPGTKAVTVIDPAHRGMALPAPAAVLPVRRAPPAAGLANPGTRWPPAPGSGTRRDEEGGRVVRVPPALREPGPTRVDQARGEWRVAPQGREPGFGVREGPRRDPERTVAEPRQPPPESPSARARERVRRGNPPAGREEEGTGTPAAAGWKPFPQGPAGVCPGRC